MKIDRLIGILTILMQKEKVTAPYLAEKFEVSRRTINRDIEDMCKARIPIVTLQGKNGGISIMEGYQIDKTLLTNDDIKGMSKHDLALARNEIYARHGRKFQTEEYSKYFSGKSWYSINPNYNYSDDDSNLNSIEVKNVQFILNAERN